LCIFTSCITSSKHGIKANPAIKQRNKDAKKYRKDHKDEINTHKHFIDDIKHDKSFKAVFDNIYINKKKELCIEVIEDKNKIITYVPIEKPHKKTSNKLTSNTTHYTKRKVVFNDDNSTFILKKKGKYKWKYKDKTEYRYKAKDHGILYFNKEGKLTSFTFNPKCLNCPEGAHIR